MKCDYCGNKAELVGGDVIYPHRPDLAKKKIWRCAPCRAHVGCHPGTDKPLGRLADDKLRRVKMLTHSVFDPLWRGGQMRRTEAYAWLAQELGLPVEKTHIGYFDEVTCLLVCEAVRNRSKQKC